ncbi:MAG: DUF3405 domain-containing protein [Methanoregulaceae archaeon]|nr:DUF3405 domain-containing protein [Methanoregulaceae archaeon]
MTHIWDQEIEKEFERFLHITYPGSPEVWLILDAKTPGAKDIARRFKRCHVVVESELFLRLPYPRLERETLLDHVHFPLMDFYLTNPGYDYYWVVEFDVRYTGEWESFLRSFESFDHDLITSHIRHYHEEPSFGGWCTLQHPTETIDKATYLRSFNVIYRISNRALALIHGKQKNGWRGFAEVLFPTLLEISGYTLLDYGGDGEYTPPGLKNISYTSGSTRDGSLNPFCTVRWRPSRAKAGIRRNKIYHPVKPPSMMEPLSNRIRFFTRWAWNYMCEKLYGPTRMNRS